MQTPGALRRGRPPKPTEHPIGGHMRQRREALGLTVREVAVRVGLREGSASYLSQIESGAKTPHPALALRLAEALRDDPRIYLAWAATGKRSGPIETARAVQTLAETLGHPSYMGVAAGRPAGPSQADANLPHLPEPWSREPGALGTLDAESGSLERAQAVSGTRDHHRQAVSRELPGIPMTPPAMEVPQAKILVPEIAEGTDPGDDARAGPRVLEVHRIAADSLDGVEPLVRPFAFRVSGTGVRRVHDVLTSGDLAIVSRKSWPLERFAPHAVRLSGHLVLSRVLWNGRLLLLLPGLDESDFIVLDAPDRTALERLIAGRVVARIRGRS
jgi:transcriptional regulator with XRE-family HTH domain